MFKGSTGSCVAAFSRLVARIAFPSFMHITAEPGTQSWELTKKRATAPALHWIRLWLFGNAKSTTVYNQPRILKILFNDIQQYIIRHHNTGGCLPFCYIRFPFPEPHVNVTWAGWRADERRRRGRRCCRFHRSQMIRSRCQRIVVCRIKASPPRPGFQCVPLREAPAPSPSRIPE